MKEKLKNEKAITLIALIITVIIMLILAGVSISIIKNQGLITKSKEATDKYNKEAGEEQANLTEWERLISQYSKWWELTEAEKAEVEFGSEGTAIIAHDGADLSSYVALTKNTVLIVITKSSELETYAYYFGEGDPYIPWCQGIELERGVWYYITSDGSYALTKEKYNGTSPIVEKNYSNIVSKTYLQRIIDSFNYNNNSNNSDTWYELTKTEEAQVEFGSEGIGNIAVKGNGSTAGSISVVLSKNENWVGIQYLTNTEIDIYVYYFGEGEGSLSFLNGGVKLEKNKTWYYMTTDGSNILTKEEYKGSSPIKKEDFTDGEIISETYLQRVINSF